MEIDHIVPKSLSWDNGLNNKVLCYKTANRGKGQKTPKDWMMPQQFEEMLQRLSFLDKEKPERDSYFTERDNARKWDNLNSGTPELRDFINSQYTDTAYAAKQVTQWLNDTLYSDKADGHRRVFNTNGRYTKALRMDLQLQDSEGPKNRGDHRNHAIDAVAIALAGPDMLQELSARAKEQEIFHQEHSQWTKRDAIDAPEPWKSVKEFRDEVFRELEQIVVGHRPVKRRLVGKLHLDTAYGKAREYPGLYSFKMSAKDQQFPWKLKTA